MEYNEEDEAQAKARERPFFIERGRITQKSPLCKVCDLVSETEGISFRSKELINIHVSKKLRC